MSPLLPLALLLAPELARWVREAADGPMASAIGDAVQAATGTAEPDTATAVLARDPTIAANLRLALARIAASQDSAARAADLSAFATLAGQQGAATARLGTSWSAPIVSAIVLATFAAVMLLVLVRGVPPGTDTVANMLLGTLAAMATSVVSYWVGSSAGSARKDERLAQSVRPPA